MTDNLTPEDRRRTMQAVKSKDTRLERRLFAMLAGMGLKGWNKHAREVQGKPDVVFPLQKVAIFVDGCFWHGCSTCNRPLPQTNQEYWEKKIGRNVRKAEATDKILRADGWSVIRIWGHELTKLKKLDGVRALIRHTLKESSLG